MPSVVPLTSRPNDTRLRPVRAPRPRADVPVARDDAAADGEHERDGEVCRRRVEDAGRVRDRDASGRAGADVDAVVADAVVRDEPQRGEAVEVERPRSSTTSTSTSSRRAVGRADLDLAELVPRRAGQPPGRKHLHPADATTLSP